MTPQVRYEYDGITRIASTASVHLGSEHRPPGAPGWDGQQRTGVFDVVAFSLRPVRVRFEGEATVMLCPGVVALPGAATGYRRTPACDAGQRTIFFGVRTHRLYDTAERRPFAPADPVACALACRLERAAFAKDGADALLIDEAAAEIIERTLRPSTPGPSWRHPGAAARKRWRGMANEVALELSREDPPSLDEMADAHEVSPAYLARVFRQQFGQTMHACYRLARLARALERLPDAGGKLTTLAHQCGFSSHAHFSRECRAVLGMTPSQLGSEALPDLIAAVRRGRLTGAQKNR